MMTERFQFLLDQYVKGALTTEEIEELESLMREDFNLQQKFAQAVIDAPYLAKNTSKDGHPLGNQNPSDAFLPAKPAIWQQFTIVGLVLVALAIPLVIFWIAYQEQKNIFNHSMNTEKVADKSNQSKSSPRLVIESIIGDVSLERDHQVRVLQSSDICIAEDILITKPNSFLVFLTVGGSRIYLNENSKMVVSDVGIKLKRGDLYGEITKEEQEHFGLDMGSVQIQLHMLDAAVEWSCLDDAQEAVVKVRKGVVEFTQTQEGSQEANFNFSVKEGQSLSVKPAKVVMNLQSILDSQIAPWHQSLIQQLKDFH